MHHKPLPCPQRLRRIPHQFSWIDQRLVGEGFIRRCDPDALALYLFLVTVADAQGLSYYSSRAIAQHLSMTPGQLTQACHTLIHAGLIAFAQPFYQVLSLEAPAPSGPASSPPASLSPPRAGRPQSLGTLLRQALEKKS